MQEDLHRELSLTVHTLTKDGVGSPRETSY